MGQGIERNARVGDKYGNVLYVLSLVVISISGSLLAIVAAEHRFATPDAWIAAGILWGFSLPAFIALSVLSWPLYRRYVEAETAVTTAAIYVGNLLSVMIGGVALAYAVVVLLGRLR